MVYPMPTELASQLRRLQGFLSHAQLAERLLDWLIDDAAAGAYPEEPSPVGPQVGDALRMLFTDGPSSRDRWRR